MLKTAWRFQMVVTYLDSTWHRSNVTVVAESQDAAKHRLQSVAPQNGVSNVSIEPCDPPVCMVLV